MRKKASERTVFPIPVARDEDHAPESLYRFSQVRLQFAQFGRTPHNNVRVDFSGIRPSLSKWQRILRAAHAGSKATSPDIAGLESVRPASFGYRSDERGTPSCSVWS